MNLNAYDDMMGLEFGDYEGMGQLFNAEMLKEALIASTAGGGAILAAAWGVRTLSEQFELSSRIENPLLRATLLSGGTLVLGVAAGRALYEYNREAAMGVVGGLGGLAMASWLDELIAFLTGNPKLGMSLGEGDDYMTNYGAGDNGGMDALAMLETTGVNTAPGAFSGFADPTVTPEALMGLDGTVVQEETLGGMGAYAPYLS